jgi:hypothetical protein
MAQNTLSLASLNWARKHLIKENDTDLFPLPFEITILSKDWLAARRALSNIDVSSHRWSQFRKILIPKDEFMFRSVCQLAPIDSFLFSALVRTIGAKIESRRAPNTQVFSYRFNPTKAGEFYGGANNWEGFWSRSRRIAKGCGCVAIADITDFYNQIYHHTFENEMINCKIAKSLRTSLLNLAKSTTDGVSKGLPVGPHGAHLLAELCLIPVDNYLISKGYTFCRYVDDIHIFCKDRQGAQAVIYDLADILDKTQKLTLNRAKTVVLESEEFVRRADQSIVDNPINHEEEEILQIIKTRVRDPYRRISLRLLSPSDIARLSKDKIEAVLRAYLESAGGVDYVRLRWFLRRLAQVGAPGGVEFIVRNVDKLLPAIADATLYLQTAEGNYGGDWQDVGGELVHTLQSPLFRRSEYLSVIMINLFSRVTDLDHHDRVLQLYDDAPGLAKRKIVLVAATAGAADWLRRFRTTIGTLDPWLRRAVLYAARILPTDERRFWVRQVANREDLLEQLIAAQVR